MAKKTTQPTTTIPKKPALQKVVFNGITYEMSSQDYNLFMANNAKLQEVNAEIQTILSRSHVSDENLDVSMKSLIGHLNVVYVLANRSGYNTDKYNGYNVSAFDHVDKRNLAHFMDSMKEFPEFDTRYTIETPVIMTIDAGSDKIFGEFVKDPKYSKAGKVAVGNIVVRNKNTGKLELYCGKSWIGCSYLIDAKDAASNSMKDFLHELSWNDEWYHAMIKAHNKKSK